MGGLFVISGPSGTGKGTIAEELRREGGCALSISATTRPPRPGEKEGISYFFKTVDEFEAMKEEGRLLEYALVHGNYYGTPRAYVDEQRALGRDVILEIDVQGGLNVKRNAPEACLIFVTPPSLKELENRLRGRKTESEEQIGLRLENARREYGYIDRYDYLIVNDDLNEAVRQVKCIIECKKLEVSSGKDKIDTLLKGREI